MALSSTLGGLTPSQRISPEQLVVDRGRKHAIEGAIGLRDGTESKWLPMATDLGRESREPRAQHRRCQLAERDVPQLRQDVVAQVRVVDPLSCGS